MTRQSNIELARIVAMIFVVVVHANYYSLGEVYREELRQFPIGSFLRVFVEQLCAVCVNLFVLISGWFGMKLKGKGILSVLYQTLFYVIAIAAIAMCMGLELPINDMAKAFYFGSYYWFVPCYLLLYCLSPVLNAFIDSSESKALGLTVLTFFAMEFIYGNTGETFNRGYSPIHFIGIYLLGRFLNIQRDRTPERRVCLSMFCVISFLSAILSYIGIRFFDNDLHTIWYCSPYIVLASASLFLYFTKLEFQSKAVNYIGASCFATYLIHMHPCVSPYFRSSMNWLYSKVDVVSFFLIVFVIAVLLVVACSVIDKVRMWTWNRLCKIL